MNIASLTAAIVVALLTTGFHAQAQQAATAAAATATTAPATKQKISTLGDLVKLARDDGRLAATWVYSKEPRELGRFSLGDPALEMSAAATPGKFYVQNENYGSAKDGDLNRFILQGDQGSVWISIGYRNPKNGLVYMEYVQKPGRPVLYLRTIRKDGNDIQSRAEAENFEKLQEKLSEEDKTALSAMLAMLTSKTLVSPPAAQH